MASATITQKRPKKTRPPAKNRRTSIRTYRSALKYLNARTNYETMLRVGYNHTNFNLSRMLRVLAGLGNPHKSIRTIHIAGTKGKGSTACMTAAMLQNAGIKVGVYTSPHFVTLRERIVIDGRMISEPEFARVIRKVAAAADRLKGEQPTFFELVTAAAMLYFAHNKVDLAVMEAGLGGRLDSTNVIKPEVCGLTSISYDHVAQLGNTLEKIAEEKAGIFKPGVPVVSAPQLPGVKAVFQRVAARVGCDLKFVRDDLPFSCRFESSRITGPHIRVCMTTPTSRFDHLPVPLLGEHQAHNLGVVLGIIDALRGRGFEFDQQELIDGLAKVRIEGRLEEIKVEPRTVVDAAHNAASVAALMRAIGQNITYDSMVVIFGCSADKDVDGMLKQLRLGADKLIFTSIPSPRSADPKELLTRFAENSTKMAQVAATLPEAYTIARNCVTRDDLICITGSVYLVGQAKKLVAAGELD